ncbi:response regulator [soil metagenome]
MEIPLSHPQRIFLADDDEDDRFFFKEALNQVTTDVILQIEVDGVRLMRELKSAAKLPELIFLDLNMPNKNGKECLVEIRSSDMFRNIPVIIFSTSCHHRDVEEAYSRGANLFIQKPAVYPLLVNLLRKVLVLNWNEYVPRPERSKFILTT